MNTPRIAVDARPLSHPATGIYRYTFELLRRMCQLGGEWFFYSIHPYDTAAFPFENVHHRIGSLPRFLRLGQMGQVIFPRWAKKDHVDIFWSPRHHLPLFLDRSIPSIVTIHDLVWLRHGETMRFPGRQIEALLMPRALQRAERVVAVSKFTASELEACFPQTKGRVDVIPNASLLPPMSEGDVETEIEPEEPYFLFVGTPEPRKNLPRFLEAYSRYIKLDASPIKLKVVGGGGWGGVDLGGLVSDLGLGAHVDLCGRVNDERLPQLYRGAYATVVPSIYEGFGLPVIESLSQGVPVIVSRGSAMSEVAGTAGLEVDPWSVTEMRDALLRIVREPALHDQLRKNAGLEASRYSWDESAAKMYQMIESASRR